jgi:hypothetical protein
MADVGNDDVPGQNPANNHDDDILGYPPGNNHNPIMPA